MSGLTRFNCKIFQAVEFLIHERSYMRHSKRKRKMIPIFAAEDRLAGNKDAKPIGWMSDPDEFGPVFVDMETLKRLATGTDKGEE